MSVTAALASLIVVSVVGIALLLTASLLRDRRLAGRPSRRERVVRVALTVTLAVALTGWATAARVVLTQDLGEDHASLGLLR